jgi:hypothetical protein
MNCVIEDPPDRWSSCAAMAIGGSTTGLPPQRDQPAPELELARGDRDAHGAME